jgi:hypothetical protein
MIADLCGAFSIAVQRGRATANGEFRLTGLPDGGYALAAL